MSSYLFLIIVRDVEYNFTLGQLTAGNAGKLGNKRPFFANGIFLVLPLILRAECSLSP